MGFRVIVKQNDLARIAAELRPRASAVVRKTALDIEADAKGRAPVDTGALRNSIQTTMDGDLSASVGTNIEYAPFQEMGTHRMAAHPFMTPAAEAHRQPFIDAMSAVVEP